MPWSPVFAETFGAAEAAWLAVLADPFTGSDNDPPDTSRWTVDTEVTGDATADATIQDDELELRIDGGTDNANESAVHVTAITADELNARIDFSFAMPVAATDGGVYFFNAFLRYDGDFPLSAATAYRLFIRRNPGSGTPDFRNAKVLEGVFSDLSLAPVSLSNSVARYNARFQVTTDGPDVVVRSAIRDASLGPIGEGVWDHEDTDSSSPITAAGVAGVNFSRGTGGTTGVASRSFLIDDVVISKLVGASWVATNWTVNVALDGDADADAEVVGGEGRLRIDGGSNDANESVIVAYVQIPELLGKLRFECEYVLPDDGASAGRFFDTIALRCPNNAGIPDPDIDAYRVFIRRNTGTGTPIWSLAKEVGGVLTNVNSTADINLSNAVARYLIRAEIETVGGEAVIKASVRDASLGPIAEGDWDRDETDSTSPILGTGTVRLLLSRGSGASSGAASRHATFENIVISEFVAPGGGGAAGRLAGFGRVIAYE